MRIHLALFAINKEKMITCPGQAPRRGLGMFWVEEWSISGIFDPVGSPLKL